MKLLGSTQNEITKDKNGKKVPYFGITEEVLVHCNIVNNDHQQDSRALFTFFPNKPCCRLLEIAPKKSYLFKNIQAIEACFADQNSQPLEIKDRINLTLVIK